VGLTAAQVAQEVRGALVGTTATRIVIDADGNATDVFVRVDPESVQSVDDLSGLLVGTVVKKELGEIATVEQVTAKGSITRIDQSPAASISAEIASEDTGKVSATSPAVELKAAPGDDATIQVAGKTLLVRFGAADMFARYTAPVALNGLQLQLPLGDNRDLSPQPMPVMAVKSGCAKGERIPRRMSTARTPPPCPTSASSSAKARPM